MERTKIGIIGCGVISNTYLHDITQYYRELEVTACGDVNPAAAQQKAREYEIPHAYTVEQLLEDPEIVIVINLTPPKFHGAVNRRILEAGKHVFCEKPFALSMKEAREIADLAREKQLYVGCAPDTFLGSSLQSCGKLIRDGWIGKPLYATANMMSGGVETWHPSPDFFYKEGGGPLFDMGPYYLTALVTLLGRIEKIQSVARTGFEKRTIYSEPRRGQELTVEIPTHYSAILQMEDDIAVSMNLSFDIWYSSLPRMEIYGTEGTLVVPDPNMSGGEPLLYRFENTIDGVYGEAKEALKRPVKPVQVPELYHRLADYTRGLGVLELAHAIREKRDPRTGTRLACHVTEAMNGMMEAARSGSTYVMQTDCERPEPLPLGGEAGRI